MPYPLVPPPANDVGAFGVPRRLQRWLDVNPVTRLTRTSSYITLPSFSQAVTWQGYSVIVASFNFEGPNNFSLKYLTSEMPLSPNYCLCIMWKDSNNVVYRYALWKGVGEVFYFNVPLYTGQEIKKNFRFEIWSTNSTPAVQTTTLQFYTSVLGNFDYRFAGDYSLVTADAINTSFNCTTSLPPGQEVIPAGSVYGPYGAIIGDGCLYLITGFEIGQRYNYILGNSNFLVNTALTSFVSSPGEFVAQYTSYYVGVINNPAIAGVVITATVTTYDATFSLPLVFPSTSQPQPN
jgi:hypothetical protein